MPRIHDMRTMNDKQLQGDDSADAPRSFRDAVHSLDEIAKRSVNLVSKPLPEFEALRIRNLEPQIGQVLVQDPCQEILFLLSKI